MFDVQNFPGGGPPDLHFRCVTLSVEMKPTPSKHLEYLGPILKREECVCVEIHHVLRENLLTFSVMLACILMSSTHWCKKHQLYRIRYNVSFLLSCYNLTVVKLCIKNTCQRCQIAYPPKLFLLIPKNKLQCSFHRGLVTGINEP